MQFGVCAQDEFKTTGIYCYVEHEGTRLEWTASDVLNKKKMENFDVFEHVNDFIKILSPIAQEKIWQAYQDSFDILRAGNQPVVLVQHLQKQVKIIYDEIAQDKAEQFIQEMIYARRIGIPKRYVEVYVQSDDKPGSREKTYTRQDYIKLIALSLSLRFLIPIWGEFISLTKGESGTTHKKLVAYSLLAKTDLIKAGAIEKLTTYIGQNLKEDRSLTSAVVAHIGREDYVPWLLAGLVVERVCSGDIRGQEDSVCLVVTCYNYISPLTKASGQPNNLGDMIRRKEFSSGEGGDQDPSRLEGYKIKAQHSQGQIAPFQVYLRDSNLHNVAKQLYPGVDLALLERFKQANMELLKNEVSHCQVCLMAWILKPVFSPRAAFHLRKEWNATHGSSLINGLSLAQTVLWQSVKHRKLALMITALPMTNEVTHHIGGYGTISRILKEQTTKLGELFPYQRIPRGKPNTKVFNPAVNAINLVSDGFTASDWMLTVPSDILTEFLQADTKIHRRVSAPHEIKILLADLVTDIAAGQWLA